MNRRGRFRGARPNWIKAFVTLAEGDSIDLFDVV
jgi:ribosomal protein L23